MKRKKFHEDPKVLAQVNAVQAEVIGKLRAEIERLSALLDFYGESESVAVATARRELADSLAREKLTEAERDALRARLEGVVELGEAHFDSDGSAFSGMRGEYFDYDDRVYIEWRKLDYHKKYKLLARLSSARGE